MAIDSFGPLLKELRNSRKMTIRELEKLSGVSNSYISQMERGERNPSPHILKKFSGVFNIPMYDLLIAAGHYDEEDLLDPISEVREGIIKKVKKEQELRENPPVELEDVLQKDNVTFRKEPLNESNRHRVLEMLNVLFPEK